MEIDLRAWTLEEVQRVEEGLKALKPVLPGARLVLSGGLNRPPMEPTEASLALFAKARAIGEALGLRLGSAGWAGVGRELHRRPGSAHPGRPGAFRGQRPPEDGVRGGAGDPPPHRPPRRASRRPMSLSPPPDGSKGPRAPGLRPPEGGGASRLHPHRQRGRPGRGGGGGADREEPGLRWGKGRLPLPGEREEPAGSGKSHASSGRPLAPGHAGGGAGAHRLRHRGRPPVGHNTPLPAYLDEDLLGYPEVWAAGGTPRALFRATPKELLALTGAQVADLKEG